MGVDYITNKDALLDVTESQILQELRFDHKKREQLGIRIAEAAVRCHLKNAPGVVLANGNLAELTNIPYVFQINDALRICAYDAKKTNSRPVCVFSAMGDLVSNVTLPFFGVVANGHLDGIEKKIEVGFEVMSDCFDSKSRSFVFADFTRHGLPHLKNARINYERTEEYKERGEFKELNPTLNELLPPSLRKLKSHYGSRLTFVDMHPLAETISAVHSRYN
jgi:hypothetical protein